MIRANKSQWTAVVLASALWAISVDASAAIQVPANRNDTVEATLDRGTAQAAVKIFHMASGGYDTSDALKWGQNSWTCVSATDSATGACPTEPVLSPSGDSSTIQLSFKEAKTGASTVLNLHGEVRNARHVNCSGQDVGEIFGEARMPINSADRYSVASCTSRLWDGRALTITIPSEELKKIPTGGIWRANLLLNLRQWSDTGSNHPKIAVFKAAIKLNVTDKNNIQVYLPEFTNATPVVDLKLRTLPNGSRLSGTSAVDMCLYDGYNSQSTWFDVTASDGLTIDRRDKGSYSVLLESDKSGAYASRVDYNASLTYAGKKIVLPNKETVRLQGVNNSAGRTVSLPGIPVPVVCTPTPLTLTTPEFQSVWKRPGKYRNKLTITFTPSSASL
ncbi:CfaE/CblD family pilus tip adhesin [Burkholderia diffusa]|uniref:CfaE/CblD family pilus tip adhesin n=1 Tax=Burkholderia diffusa TaxID=488732 RepID=UPI00075878FE|nr:CfaE/CblD family pilus tip adhesin [Burkholderia diffusa]KVC48673.1 pilin protein [Burkholderia diffusa]